MYSVCLLYTCIRNSRYIFSFQDEIQGKMKAIQNVIDMLSSIIKDGKSISDLEAMLSPSNGEKHKSPVTHVETNHKHHKKEIAPDPNNFESYNYVHYDTGLHWCRMCDEFPETAKDYLLHLQDKSHRQLTKENDVDNTPWHKLPAEPVLPSDENAPTKRVPIKGIMGNFNLLLLHLIFNVFKFLDQSHGF